MSKLHIKCYFNLKFTSCPNLNFKDFLTFWNINCKDIFNTFASASPKVTNHNG